MASGAGSGVVHSLTFTPAVAGRLVVTVTYEAEGASGSAWGSSYRARAFMTQSATTTLADLNSLDTTRGHYTARGVFDVAAGATVECGLWGQISGAVSASFYNINVNAELIKR
jgi:hypothetical protein